MLWRVSPCSTDWEWTRIADSSFNAVDGMRYRPYGGSRDAGHNLKTDHKFTGQIEDASIGLYWFNSRAYDPGIGRFVVPDTIVPEAGNPQALNRYSYVYNNPMKFIDPSGHDGFDVASLVPNWFGDEWVSAFRAAHGGADPQAGDYLYRLATMAVAHGILNPLGGAGGGGGDRVNGIQLPRVEVTSGFGQFGGGNNEAADKLYGLAYGCDMAALVVLLAHLALAGVTAVIPGGQAAAPVVAGVGAAEANALSVVSFFSTLLTDVFSGRSFVSARADKDSVELKIGVGTPTLLGFANVASPASRIRNLTYRALGLTTSLDAAAVAMDAAGQNGFNAPSLYGAIDINVGGWSLPGF